MANDLTLLQLNDLHGYLAPHQEIVWTGEEPTFRRLGGVARIRTLIEKVRSERPGAVLAFDNGDTFHGTHLAVSTKGEALVPAVDSLGLSAMTGHWDFAWGPEHVERLSEQLGHPLLAANCYREEDGSRPFPASVTLEAAGLKVGVIGLAATIIDKGMPPRFSTGVRFTDGPDEARAEAERLRADGADLIIVLSHLGLPQDAELARRVPDLDVILSGHTHDRITEPLVIGRTLVIQSGCHGSFVGRLDLSVGDRKVASHRHELIPIDGSLEEHPDTARLVAEALEADRDLSRVVGETPRALHRFTCLDAPMDDVLLAAIARAAGTDIAFSNGWRYGAPVPPGPVTMEDLWNIVPVDPVVSLVELTGAEILQTMEASLQRTFACDPFEQRGGYVKRFRGLTFHAKLQNPPRRRIERAFVGDARLEPERSYTVSFIAAQGVPPRMGRDRRDLDVRAIEALEAWFAEPEWSESGSPLGVGRVLVV